MIGKPFKSFGSREEKAVSHFGIEANVSGAVLSGYLAGRERGGKYVCALEDACREAFHVKHAIATNSATSGLLAASFAIGLKRGDKFAVSSMTMSATAAAPMFTGATPHFCDVATDDFGISATPTGAEVKAVFITNLFGHPAALHAFRAHADRDGTYLIEDNAQAPFAMETGKYTGTIGHIGVFSLNIHKPLQCGEGGIIVTNNDELAEKMRAFINHGENVGENIGLNLRMPELCAVVALEQIRRGPAIINNRIEQAEAIINEIGHIDGIRPPVVLDGCTHVYYAIPFLIERNRREFVARLRALLVPVVEQYVPPLYYLPAFERFKTECKVADDLYHRGLFYIENCAWTFNKTEIKAIGAAFRRAAETVL